MGYVYFIFLFEIVYPIYRKDIRNEMDNYIPYLVKTYL